MKQLEQRVLLSSGQIFVGDTGSGSSVVSEYTGAGTAVATPFLQTAAAPVSVAVSNSDLFVADSPTSIGEYSTSGATINATLISGSEVDGFAISGSDIFASDASTGTVGEYTTAGTAVNADLISDANGPHAIAISGSDLFVVNMTNGTIGEYTTAGQTVNAALITVSANPSGIAISGSNLFVADSGPGTVAEYTTMGAAVNTSLLSGLSAPEGLAVYGSDLYVANSGAHAIGEYTTGGAVVNAALISGLSSPQSLAFVGPGTQLAFATDPSGATAGGVITPPVSVDVEDSNGNLDSLDNSNVTLSIASGPAGGVLAGTATVAAQNGVATFSNLTLTKSGAYTLTVADGSLASVTSTSFVIQAGAATQLAFAQAPSNGTTDTVITPALTVDVEDADGNLVSTDTSNVTLAIASGPAGGVLSGTATVAAVGGVATFNTLSLSPAGTYTLTATDGSYTAAASGALTISAPAQNRLVFTQEPVNTLTTSTLATVKVDIETSASAIVTGSIANVTLAVVSGPNGATLGGTTTVAAVAGVATFSSLSLPTPGTYALIATDNGGDTSGTSSSFTISVPGANKLAVATQPQNATAGAVLNPVEIDIENSAGTLLTTGTSSVTLAIASGPDGAALGGTVTVAALGGVATFNNLSLAIPGTYTLTATDGADTAVTTGSFTVSASSADKLAFATEPVGGLTTAGLGTMRVDVENSAGTLLTADNSSVTLTIATGTAGAALDGTTTVAAVNGVATFSNVFINTAGTNYTLTATDGADVPATSTAFTVTAPVVPNTLAYIVEPVNTSLAGTLGSIQLDVEDSTGAVVTANGGNITVSITGAPAGVVLGGTTTVAAVNGVATFANLTINKIGTYTLTASEAGVTPATSTAFTVYYPPVIVGQLDPAFGVGGLIKSNVGFTSTAGTANDGNGEVIIGTTGTVPDESFSIARYNSDGSLDTTFGTLGIATLHFANTDDVPSAVQVLPGGQILIAGTATTYVSSAATTSQFAVAELNANGTLDTAFGGGTGEVQFGFSTAATQDVCTAMAVSSKGIIYLGGRSDSRSTTGNDFAILALNSAGTPDASFGAGGQVLIDFDDSDDTINSLALQTNGDLVAAGSATISGVVEIGLARLLPTGVLDRRFGTNGLVTTSVRDLFDSATSVAIESDGDLVIGGLSEFADSSDFFVGRYLSNGRIDKSFGGGAVVTSFGQPSAVTQVIVQPNGEIIASGKMTASLSDIVSSQMEVALARYTARGVLDTTFDGTGKTLIDLSTATFTTAAAVETPLDTELNELIDSKQGSAVLTAGTDLLATGNSGTSTVESEILTTGVDLSATLSSMVPTAIAGGTKATATVVLTEVGADLASGTVTLDLELATDAQGNGAIPLKTVAERISLAGGRSHAYKIPFVYPTTLTGNYYLLADVISGTTPALRDLNQLNNLSPAGNPVAITPPFQSLEGSALSALSALTPGKVAHVEFTITNDGNVLAKGKTSVDLYLSTNQTVAGGTLIPTNTFAIALLPGASHIYRLSVAVPKTIAAGSYVLIAVVDPLNSLGATDHSRGSTIMDAAGVTVG
jgi:uncharacterized delta-60 repeat protein